MKDTTPILQRRNIKYNIVIKCSILILCSLIILIGISAIPKKETKKSVEKEQQTENKKINALEKNDKLSAGISQHIIEISKKPQVETSKLSAGISRHVVEVLKEPVKVEQLEVDTVTSAIDTEPEIIYKSLKEVKISRDMDLTKTTGLSKKDFINLLSKLPYDYVGFYKKNADIIWEFSQEYNVNEIFICGVFALESYYGSSEKHISAHNYGSIMTKGGELVNYANDAEGIKANFKLFANCYLSPDGKYYKGVTLDSIGNTYCPPTPECPSWADKVYECMQIFLEDR